MRQLPWAYWAGDSARLLDRSLQFWRSQGWRHVGVVGEEEGRCVYSARKSPWSGMQRRKWEPSPWRKFCVLCPNLYLNSVKKRTPSRWQHQITGVKQGFKATLQFITLHCNFLWWDFIQLLEAISVRRKKVPLCTPTTQHSAWHMLGIFVDRVDQLRNE